jgi:alcohol dehydrogenase class IV
MEHPLKSPARTMFGAGTLEELNREIPPFLHRILLVVGNHVVTGGLLARVREILDGRELVVCHDIQPEPPLPDVQRLIDAGRRNGVHAVVAIGGGSVIDSAKTAAALIPASGGVEDYFNGSTVITAKGLFFAALPTTAGTGAEISPNAVLTDPATQIKKSLRHDTMMADVAIIDPDLLAGCSEAVAVYSGLDAFTQAVESYISLGATEPTRRYALYAARLLYRNLPVFCADRGNAEARSGTAEGSMLGAIAFTASGLGAAHGLGHPIGALLHLPHGLCCAILLPKVLRWNQPVCGELYAELGKSCGVEDFVGAVEELCRKLGVPENFRSYGLNESHDDFILKNCRSGSMKQNPRPMSDDEVVAFLRTVS